MQIQERDFLQALDLHFGFLVREFGYSRTDPEEHRDGITVRYLSRSVILEVALDDGGPNRNSDAVLVAFIPLEQGRVPPRFDEQLHEQLTKYLVEDVVRLYAETWSRPSKTNAVRDERDLDEVLSAYATALRTYCQGALKGDRSVFERAAGPIRDNLIRIYADEWQRFVDRVRDGFDGTIAEYTSGITQRGQLQAFVDRWRGDRSTDPRDRIRELDDLFIAHTEPVKWNFGSDLWTVLPIPTARDWWRRPKRLEGALRSYFSERD